MAHSRRGKGEGGEGIVVLVTHSSAARNPWRGMKQSEATSVGKLHRKMSGNPGNDAMLREHTHTHTHL